MDIQEEREAFEKWFKSLNENGRTTYFLGQESTVAWEAWKEAKAQAVPYEPGSFKSSHEIIINETKSELIDGYDIAKEDEYLLEILVYRGVCIGKAQAVPEQDQQVWATSNLTWKDIAFRALSCKVLKSTENWAHVKNIAGVGSTTASLICKKLGVDPNGTKFDLIEAQEPANET